MKYSVFVGPAAPPLPNASPHRCVMAIGWPSASFNSPTKWPFFGSKALMWPSPKLPTSRSLLKAAEVRRGHRDRPGLIEMAVADQALLQLAVGVVDIDGAVGRTVATPPRTGRDRGVFDVELIVDGLDIERVVVVRQLGVGEVAWQVRHWLEVLIVHVDGVVGEIGRVQQRVAVGIRGRWPGRGRPRRGGCPMTAWVPSTSDSSQRWFRRCWRTGRRWSRCGRLP